MSNAISPSPQRGERRGPHPGWVLAASAIAATLLGAACAPAAPPAQAPATPLASAVARPAQSPSPAASPAVSPVASPSPAAPRRTSLEYGISVFVWGNPSTTQRDLGVATSVGFGWQKSLFQWRAIEPTRGQFDWREADRVVQASNAAGLKILARLDFQPDWARKEKVNNGAPDNPQDFARFVTALVSRYTPGSAQGELQAIEIWNEPNLRREWGGPINQQSARQYVELLGAAYTAAKQANPKIIVVTAGLSPTGVDNDDVRPDDTYLKWLYEAGMAGKYDALGLHANGQAPDPTATPGSLPNFNHPSFYFRRVEQLRAIQEAAGEGARPVWILEFGWTSDRVHEAYAWFAVSEEQKGENLVKALRWALEHWQPWIGPMMMWTLPDPNWTQEREEYWWAIANPNGTPRPALERIRRARASGELP